MMIYHRFMCASGHFRLLNLIYWPKYLCYLSFRQTTLCVASHDINSYIDRPEMTGETDCSTFAGIGDVNAGPCPLRGPEFFRRALSLRGRSYWHCYSTLRVTTSSPPSIIGLQS